MTRTILCFCSLIILYAAAARGGAVSEAVVREINFARTNPAAYAGHLEASRLPASKARREAIAFLRKQKPLPPLGYSAPLAKAAAALAEDQARTGKTGHSKLAERTARVGEFRGVGENIAYGYADPRQIVSVWIVDEGVRGRGHRKNIFRPDYSMAGASLAGHPRYGTVCVVDFAIGK